MILACGAILLVAALWPIMSALRSVGGDLTSAGVDYPARLVVASVRYLAGERPEWAQAMQAEIDYVRGARARWTFALGCVRVALFAPRPTELSARLLRVGVLLGAGATGLLAMYVATRSPERSLAIGSATWAALVVVLSAYVGIVLARSRATNAQAVAARRLGLAGGVFVGGFMVLANSPGNPFGNQNLVADPGRNPLLGVLPLVGALGVAAVVAWSTRDMRAGVEAALWTGLLASLIFCVGLMSLTYAAPDWFTRDPMTVASWAYSWTPEHYSEYGQHYVDVATFVVHENGESAFASLLFGPAISLVLGAVGAMLGAAARAAHGIART